jgi:hypothetical protein
VARRLLHRVAPTRVKNRIKILAINLLFRFYLLNCQAVVMGKWATRQQSHTTARLRPGGQARSSSQYHLSRSDTAKPTKGGREDDRRRRAKKTSEGGGLVKTTARSMRTRHLRRREDPTRRKRGRHARRNARPPKLEERNAEKATREEKKVTRRTDVASMLAQVRSSRTTGLVP